MISTFFCRFESLDGEVVKPRTVLRLVPAPFLLLYLDDRDVSFQADFGPTVSLTTTADQEQDDDIDSVDVPRRRRKRFVEITADLLEDSAVPVSNDVGAWDVAMTKNKPSLTASSPTVTMKATTAAVKRRKKSKLTSKKSAKHSADRRRMENEVLSFDDDDDVAGLSLDDDDDGDDDGDNEDEVLSLDYEEDDLSEQEADRFRWSTGSRMSSSPSAGSGSDLLPLPRGYKSQRGGSSGGRRRIKQKKTKQGNARSNTEAAAPNKRTVSKPRGLLPSLWKSFEAQVLY
jgi:hypothetical protein